MAFNHRKLFSAPEQDVKVSDACDFFCDSTRNTEGYCPISCISRCPSVCHRPLPSLVPSPPPPTPLPLVPQDKSSNLPFVLLIALSILAAICFLFCCYTLYKFYKKWDESRNRRRRRRSAELQLEETHDQFVDQDHGPVVDHPIWYIRTVGLQPSVINSIPICKYKRRDGLVEGTDCSVCLSEFQEEDILRLLPKCNHAFHLPCIDKWLGSHTNCPLCRAGIVSQETAAAPEQSVDNLGVREENQVGISQSRGEFTREREDGERELMGTEEEGEREMETPEAEVVHQLMRRSVSLDSVSASMISLAIANANAYPRGIAGNSDSQMRNQNESNVDMVPKRVDVDGSLPKFVGNCSTCKSLQKGPISMKRSMSCSGKVLFLKYARSRNSILP